jgi:FkbM family methyltransferase
MFLSSIATGFRQRLSDVARRIPPFRGKTRAFRCLDGALRRLDQGRTLRAAVGGVHFELNTEDIIDFRISYLGAHQSDTVSYITSRLAGRPCTFWDVGANVGSVSLPVSRALPLVRVEAFEPSPSVRARFEVNRALNSDLASRISIHPWALSDRDGVADFYVSNEPRNSGVGGLGVSCTRLDEPISVASKRGDGLVEAVKMARPGLIKIDVEGFEIEVVRGLSGLLAEPSSDPIEIVFEHEPYRLRERHLTKRHLIDLLEGMGFEICKIVPPANGGSRPFTSGDLDSGCDLVATRRVEGA